MTADLLDLPNIPTTVADRIRSYRDAAADRRAALMRITDEQQEVSDKRTQASSRLQEFRRRGMADERPPLPELIAEIARHDVRLARLNARADELSPGWQHAHRLVVGIEQYVGENSNRMVAPYDGAPAELKAGENAVDALERAARRTRTLQADRREVLAAPFPSEMAKKIAWEALAARGQAAKPDVFGLIDNLEPVRFPLSRLSSEAYGTETPVHVHAVDAVGLVAWLFPIEMKRAIEREIDASADDKIALSPEQRKAKLAQIDGDLLHSEREEAAFAELAVLLPREDIDPRAVLQLADKMPPRRRED